MKNMVVGTNPHLIKHKTHWGLLQEEELANKHQVKQKRECVVTQNRPAQVCKLQTPNHNKRHRTPGLKCWQYACFPDWQIFLCDSNCQYAAVLWSFQWNVTLACSLGSLQEIRSGRLLLSSCNASFIPAILQYVSTSLSYVAGKANSSFVHRLSPSVWRAPKEKKSTLGHSLNANVTLIFNLIHEKFLVET